MAGPFFGGDYHASYCKYRTLCNTLSGTDVVTHASVSLSLFHFLYFRKYSTPDICQRPSRIMPDLYVGGWLVPISARWAVAPAWAPAFLLLCYNLNGRDVPPTSSAPLPLCTLALALRSLLVLSSEFFESSCCININS